MPAEYNKTDKLNSLIKECIDEYHEELKELSIIVLMRKGDWVSKRKTIWAKIKKATPEEIEICDCDIILIINDDIWNNITDGQQRAIIDHELSHLTCDDYGNFKIVGHDLEEFEHIVRRHGLWNQELVKFKPAMTQEILGLDDKEEAEVN